MTNFLRPVGIPTPREEAEAAVLGTILLSEDVIDIAVEEGVRPEHFRYTHYEVLFRAMLSLKDAGQPIDPLTLKARFDSPQSPVSAADIELLAGMVGVLSSFRQYCRIIREGAWFDDARRTLQEAWEHMESRDKPALLSTFSRFDESGADTPELSNIDEFMEWYDSDIKAWPFPWPHLTDASKGMKPGEVTVIGGWSGMGKSFLLAQILRACRMAGARVHEYANEMHGPTRTARTITSMTGIPSRLIERKGLAPDQVKLVMDALGGLPYETTATPGWTVEDYCRRLRKEKWDVAGIDTVTNLPCSRVDEWDRACVMLADAAAQAGTHLIEVSQLNLERDKGKKPPPVGRDLRNTGAWYQRARIVMFVHRDQESVDTGDGQALWQPTPMGHVRIEKATHGEPGMVPVMFSGKWLRFDEMETRDQWVNAA